jgi:hypothetical protein
MAGPKQGTNIKNKDGFDFKATQWENSGKEGDKGTRESSNWESKGGGWSKTDSHSTNQNEPKGSPDRH